MLQSACRASLESTRMLKLVQPSGLSSPPSTRGQQLPSRLAGRSHSVEVPSFLVHGLA